MDDNSKVWSYEFEKDKEIKAGKLLLAEPFMPDENFRRTVVLVCEHHPETGSVGLILNKPINLRLQDVIEDFPPYFSQLHLGGPVGTDTLQYVHTLGTQLEDSLPLADNLFWGGNFQQLQDMIKEHKVPQNSIRFFLGYSGWGANQLEEEMKSNSWIVAQARYSNVFSSDYENLWKETMNKLGGVYSTMASYPENPNLN